MPVVRRVTELRNRAVKHDLFEQEFARESLKSDRLRVLRRDSGLSGGVSCGSEFSRKDAKERRKEDAGSNLCVFPLRLCAFA